jgi:transcriptional regulator with XRE-family HTH domain
MKPIDIGIGKNIRKLRKATGMTLAEMADLCHCSSGLLSQIETGAVNPSLGTLKSIADVLRVTLGQLLNELPVDESTPPFLMKTEERKLLTMEGGIQFQLLSRSIKVPFEFIQNRWPPGSSTGKDLYNHEGEECGMLIEGELIVETNDKTYHMKPGDSITLSSSTPHRITNPGEKEAVAVWVNSMPWVFAVK